MKRAKRIYILLGVLIVVCAAAFAVIEYEEQKELIQNSGEVILEVNADEVQSLSWEYESETLAFHRDGTWLYDEDEAFPVDEDKINELLDQFREFTAAFIIEEVTDYGQYGLDEPICTIDLATEEESYEILLGDYSAMDSQRYVSIGDGNVYLVANDPLDYFDAVLSDMIDHDETPDFDQVESIQFTGPETYEVVYEEDSSSTYCSDDVYFRKQGDTLLPLDTTRVNSYLSGISSLNPTDYVTYNASEEDLATYGLDDPELIVSVDYVAEDSETGEETASVFTISVSRDPAERSAASEETEAVEDTEAEETDEEEITAYVRIGESKIIYQITGSSYESLMAASYNDLRHQEVLTADFSDITGFDVTLEGTLYQITSTGEGDDKVFSYGEEELETSDLQSALENLIASGFTDEEPTEKEEISLTVYLDNENYPEVQIQLYRYDGEQCLAVVDGEPVSLVPRSSVVDLIEAINAIVL